jgi:hypothetical protein
MSASEIIMAAAGAAAPATYIEDVFSTYLYTGAGASTTVTNDIDLAGKGGLVWWKSRANVQNNWLVDSARGTDFAISSNTTSAQTSGFGFTFNSNGYTGLASNGFSYVSWTFRKQPKFFDVVTYTGNGTAGRTIAHSLGSVPGCMIVRPTSAVDDWFVYHRSLLNSQSLFLNLTAAASNTPSAWNSTTPTDTVFTVGTNSATNANGVSYVAYLFAHNAGGFGLTGTDNVISCGSFTTDGSGNATVNLGYEAQWVLMKRSSGAEGWMLFDNMRGLVATPQTGSYSRKLVPNSTAAESDGDECRASSTGFNVGGVLGGATYVYVAIRRGPMKVPTDATKVYNAISRTGTGATANVTGVGFPPDMLLDTMRSTSWTRSMWDRLRGPNLRIATNQTSAETSYTDAVMAYGQDGVTLGADGNFDVNGSGYTYINWFFRRAPSFFDEVCYTGTGVTHTETHNLGVAPELIIVKRRASATASWAVYAAPLTASYVGFLDLTNAFQADNMWNSTAPTSTAFTVRAANAQVNASGSTYVAYLFATCAGVSKVGSYTGTGATQTISCGFTGGARWVMVKRIDSTGDWYVWDTVRGMVSGNDPSLLLNSSAAEVNANSVYTTTGGFQIVSTAAGINANGGTYIFLAIA